MTENTPTASPPPKLLDQVRDRIRVKHYSIRTETQYVQWIKRFIVFHDKRHPKEMGAVEVETFLTHIAVEGNVAAATLKQAMVGNFVSLPRSVEHQSALAGWRGTRQNAAAFAGGVDAARGGECAGAHERGLRAARAVVVRHGDALDGVRSAAGEGCRF